MVVSLQMSHAKFLVTVLICALVALIPLAIVAWMTSGAWSPKQVGLAQLFLVFPMVVATAFELDRTAALFASFVTYWIVALAVFTSLTRRSSGAPPAPAELPR